MSEGLVAAGDGREVFAFRGEQLLHHLRVGLPSRFLHHLTDEEALEGHLAAGVLLELLGTVYEIPAFGGQAVTDFYNDPKSVPTGRCLPLFVLTGRPRPLAITPIQKKQQKRRY